MPCCKPLSDPLYIKTLPPPYILRLAEMNKNYEKNIAIWTIDKGRCVCKKTFAFAVGVGEGLGGLSGKGGINSVV